MGKYSDIVKGKTQSGLPENQKAIKPENYKTGNNESSNSGKKQNIIASNTENIKIREPENQKTIQEDMVNLSIKVPKRLRQKWVAESRLRGTTLTAIITDYLKTELGE